MILTNPAHLFQGHISLENTEKGIQSWRLPVENRDLFSSPEDSLMKGAARSSGVRLFFQTDAESIRLNCQVDCEDPVFAFDLTQDGQLLKSVGGKPDPKAVSFDFPLTGRSDRPYQIWLPQFGEVLISSVEPLGGTFFSLPDDKRVKWLSYGSSITHCRQADTPAQTWPAVAARKLNLNLTSLGFGGQCHLDGMVAKVIRDRSVDIITLKLGFNVQGNGSLNSRSYLPAVINMIDTIREKHPIAPLGIISPIYSCDREDTPNQSGVALKDCRRWDKEAVELFQKRGDSFLHYFDGLQLFGPDKVSLLPDNLHPNNEGYRIMGHRAAESILPVLLSQLK